MRFTSPKPMKRMPPPRTTRRLTCASVRTLSAPEAVEQGRATKRRPGGSSRLPARGGDHGQDVAPREPAQMGAVAVPPVGIAERAAEDQIPGERVVTRVGNRYLQV